MTKLKYTTARTMTMLHLSWFYTLLFILCSQWIQSTCAFSISSQGFQTTIIYGGPFRSPDSVSKHPFPPWTRQSRFYAITNNNSKEEETKTTTLENSEDIPRPTEAGGYSHTSASKAKISAANKGKTPWNKGKARSEEVKQRIAEGVRRRNRERFLLKLQEMGITEEEYEAKKKEERRIKDAERRARKTENGGYRPTEETKAKISKILKEKFAKGEIKKREYKGPFRKGFTHSEETRAKISQTLKKKWAEDPAYQEKMRNLTEKTSKTNVRAKISNTLKEKWKDPEFRQKMIDSMKDRKTTSTNSKKSLEYRAKISAAMKKKWQDDEYRKKAITGIQKYREQLPTKPPTTKTSTKKKSTTEIVTALQPMTNASQKVKKTAKRKSTTKKQSTKKDHSQTDTTIKADAPKKNSKTSTVKLVQSVPQKSMNYTPPPEEKKLSDDGDISRMREERRDLYDLLYGDDGDMDEDDIDSDTMLSSFSNNGIINADKAEEIFDDEKRIEMTASSLSFYSNSEYLEDDNLDDYDPYNLSDY
jgi:hypothetical protein